MPDKLLVRICCPLLYIFVNDMLKKENKLLLNKRAVKQRNKWVVHTVSEKYKKIKNKNKENIKENWIFL